MSNSRKNVGGGGGLNHNHNNANNNNNNNGKMKKPAAAVNNSQQQDKDTNGLTNGGHDEDAGDLKSVVERQSELIRQQREDLEEMKRKLEANVRISDDFRAEISEIRKNVQNDEKVERLTSAVNDIQDRLYEIDKSWKNNLVLYGIPQSADSLDEDPFILEEKVREVFHKKLHISREIAISRVSRMLHGPDFRGHKPIQICIVNYRQAIYLSYFFRDTAYKPNRLITPLHLRTFHSITLDKIPPVIKPKPLNNPKVVGPKWSY